VLVADEHLQKGGGARPVVAARKGRPKAKEERDEREGRNKRRW